MSEPRTGYGIVVSIDGSPQSEAAVRWAAHDAVLRQVSVTLMHVIAPVVVRWPAASMQGSYNKWQEENAQEVLDQALKTLRASASESELPEARTEVVHSTRVLQGLVDASHEAQMIVVGSRGMGAFSRLVLGSVSSGLAHHAHCPVAIIHADEAPDATLPVVVGIDGSPTSEAATALAFDEAARRGVDLVVLHAWSDATVTEALGTDWQQYEDEARKVVAERLAGWHDRYPDVTVQQRIVRDRPARWLIDESQRAQLVVVGSHGRGGFRGMLLGSVSAAVIQASKTPVIVVRSR
jgi:nucleotide-binding universal stress UspA family protein